MEMPLTPGKTLIGQIVWLIWAYLILKATFSRMTFRELIDAMCVANQDQWGTVMLVLVFFWVWGQLISL